MPSSGRFKSSTGIWRYSALGSDFGSETNSWRTAREPVNLTLDVEHAHVSCHSFPAIGGAPQAEGCGSRCGSSGG